jgi:hypothetical protein
MLARTPTSAARRGWHLSAPEFTEGKRQFLANHKNFNLKTLVFAFPNFYNLMGLLPTKNTAFKNNSFPFSQKLRNMGLSVK